MWMLTALAKSFPTVRCSGRAAASLLIACACIGSTGCAGLGGSGLSEWWHNGFKVGPNYGRPAAAVADAWIDAENKQVRFDRPQDVYWWTVLGDPTLDELVENAYQQNLTLRTAGMRVLEARALRAVAHGQIFPQFQEMFGSYARTQLSTNELGLGGLPGVGVPRAFDNWNGGFNLAWELDVWGRYRRNLEAADADLDSTIEDYDAILVCLIAEVATAYVEMRTFEQRLVYARGNVKAQEGSLDQATKKYADGEGEVSKLDVTQAQSNLENTRSTIPPLEIGRRQASNRVCVLLGIPPQDLSEMVKPRAEPIPLAPSVVSIGIPAELIRRRPDLRAAERDAAAASARIGVAASDLYPRFSVNGTINLSTQNPANFFNAGSTAGVINPAFNWDILNYGRIMNNIAAQDSRFQQRAIEYQNRILIANEEVENALVSFVQTQRQRATLAASVAAFEESNEIVKLQYTEGATDLNRVFVIQSDLALAQDQLAAVEGAVITNLIALYKALGTGWQMRLGVNAPTVIEDVVPSEDVPSPPEDLPAAPADGLEDQAIMPPALPTGGAPRQLDSDS